VRLGWEKDLYPRLPAGFPALWAIAKRKKVKEMGKGLRRSCFLRSLPGVAFQSGRKEAQPLKCFGALGILPGAVFLIFYIVVKKRGKRNEKRRGENEIK